MAPEDSINYERYSKDFNTFLGQLSAEPVRPVNDILSPEQARQAYLEYAGEHADQSVISELAKYTTQIIEPPED